MPFKMRRVKILEMQVGVVIKRDFGGDGTSNILTVVGYGNLPMG